MLSERGRTPPGHTRVPCEELADGVSFERLAESADRTLDNAAMERREALTLARVPRQTAPDCIAEPPAIR